MKLSAILNEYKELEPEKIKLIRHGGKEFREIYEKVFLMLINVHKKILFLINVNTYCLLLPLKKHIVVL